MTDKEMDQPWRECLSVEEYIKMCIDYLQSCFDEKGHLIRKNDLLNVECNIRAVLDLLNEVDSSAWVDISESETQ